MLRRLLPNLVIPLAVLATALTGAVWLRTFPAGTIAVPIFAAAALSVIVSLVAVRLTRRPPLVTVPISAISFVVFTLSVVLRDLLGFADLLDGFRRGPSRLISFALPLVTPLSLMVVPVALVWIAGAIAGEVFGRQPDSWIPYPAWLLAFAAGYAATARAYASGHSNRGADLGLGLGLLATLALLRVVQTWLRRDAQETPAGVENALPLRSVTAGLLVTVIALGVAAVAIENAAPAGPPRAIQRQPAVRQAEPITPPAFVASLRPTSRTVKGDELFTVNVDRITSPYLTLATVDLYDGDSWSFQRNFRPSGGVVPAEVDRSLVGSGPTVTQQYRVDSDDLLRAPWLPYLSRPRRVTGEPISVDPSSAMIVPTGTLVVGDRYTVQSEVPSTTFAALPAGWLPATSPPPVDTQVPAGLRSTLTQVTAALADETGVAASPAPAFLSAVVNDLRTNYSLTDPAANGSTGAVPSTSGRPSTSASASAAAGSTSGGTSFAAVLASILGDSRVGTPEQYATLVVLLARSLGIPARLASGFRVATADGRLTPGEHAVTASDAYSWVEIPVRARGWVVLDPSPIRYADATAPRSVGVQSATPTPSSAPATQALVTQASGGNAVAPKSTLTTSDHGSPNALYWLIPAGVAAIVVIALAGILIGKAGRRRRRRTRADPRARVIGAWQETLDLLDDAGLGDLAPFTGAEVTTASGERFGVASASAVAVLSTTANRALFSGREPIPADDAETAWRAQRDLRRALRRTMSARQRIATALRIRWSRRRH
jgi:hypothetical protein